MGIKNLNQVIADIAGAAIKHSDIKAYFGRKVAIDASMSLYQFLIAVRQQDGTQLMSDTGETTSHLMGMFYRTLRIIDNGIKPCYVFDGSPPKLKSGELAKRFARHQEAAKSVSEVKETGTNEEIDKFSRRTVRVTKQHNEECRKLLTLMGIPWIIAPCEAEAQCAALAKAGKVFAAGSEDMDTLCFGSPILLRHLTFSEQRKEPIVEIDLKKALEGLEMDMQQFVDFCILLGCDYCDPIKGVGPNTALKLIKQHGSLEKVVEHLDSTKFSIPSDWPYKDARDLFHHADITDPESVNLEWKLPDVEGLVDFLVREKGFSEERVRSGAARLIKAAKTQQQGRLDVYFTVLPKSSDSPKKLDPATKRRSSIAAANKKTTVKRTKR